MTTKLTLSIAPEVIEKAKRISLEQGKSISKMVQEYLNGLEDNREKRVRAAKNLSGVLKGRLPENVDWKQLKADALAEKYGL